MRGLKKFLTIEDKNFCRANKEEAKQNLKIEEYRMDGMV